METRATDRMSATMPLDWEHGGLAEGLRCYRRQEFFLAHEHWEDVWRVSAGPEKTFLQALIQIAAAFHHLRRQNPVGAASLLGAALRKLEQYPAAYEGVAVEPLREDLRAWIDALGRNEASPGLAFPVVR